MKASDFIHAMAVLIARHGDLEVYCDADGVVAPAADIQAFEGLRDDDEQVFVIYPGSQIPVSGSNALRVTPL